LDSCSTSYCVQGLLSLQHVARNAGRSFLCVKVAWSAEPGPHSDLRTSWVFGTIEQGLSFINSINGVLFVILLLADVAFQVFAVFHCERARTLGGANECGDLQMESKGLWRKCEYSTKTEPEFALSRSDAIFSAGRLRHPDDPVMAEKEVKEEKKEVESPRCYLRVAGIRGEIRGTYRPSPSLISLCSLSPYVSLSLFLLPFISVCLCLCLCFSVCLCPSVSVPLSLSLSLSQSQSLLFSRSLSLIFSALNLLSFSLSLSRSLSRALFLSFCLSVSLSVCILLAYSRSLSLAHTLTHSRTRSRSLSHSHSLFLSFSLALSHTHTVTGGAWSGCFAIDSVQWGMGRSVSSGGRTSSQREVSNPSWSEVSISGPGPLRLTVVEPTHLNLLL